MKTLEKLIAKLGGVYRNSAFKRALAATLAIAVALSTAFMLIMPADAVEMDVAESDPAIVLETEAEEPEVETEAEVETEPEEEEVEAETDAQEEGTETDAENLTVVMADEDVNDTETEDDSVSYDAEAEEAQLEESEETETEPDETELDADTPSYTAEAGELSYEGDGFTVTLKYDADANIPEEARLVVKEIDVDSKLYENYMGEAEDALLDGEEDKEIRFARFFDITIKVSDDEIQPDAPVEVVIDYEDAEDIDDDTEVSALHFNDDVADVIDVEISGSETELEGVSFEAEAFSVYGVAGIQSKKKLTDEDCTAEEYDADGMTVTVKETGNKKKLADYQVVVEDADEDYDDADVLKAYHIYLADNEGEEVSDAELGNGTLNLKVTLTYDETPEWLDLADTVKHHKNGAEESISAVKIDAENNRISFTVHGFSDFTIRSNTTVTTVGGVTVTTRQGSIMDGFAANDDNEWQIVSEEYSNNAAANKVNNSDDSYHSIRVQKNVIPTGIENEFNVYLSIDAKQLLMEWLMFRGHYAKKSQGNVSPSEVGNIVYNLESEQSAFTAVPVSGFEPYTKIDVVDWNGNVLVSNLQIYSNQSQNNTTIYLRLADHVYEIFGARIQKNSEHQRCLISEEAMEYIIEYLLDVYDLESVVDTLGSNIEFLGVVNGDYASEPTYSDGVLTWVPTFKSNPGYETTGSGSSTETWYLNAAELIYRVRLDVTEDGYNSCFQNMDSTITEPESYQVNQSAVLNYGLSMVGDYGSIIETGKTATFPIPYVRGLQYDIRVHKVDQDGEPLPGVQFTLSGTSGTTETDVAQVAAAAIPATSLVTDSEGNLSITELPWGTYTLTEIPPDGYSPVTTTFTAELCYTTNSTNLSASAIDDTRMMLDEWNPYLTVVNKRNLIEVEKEVIIDKTLDPDFDEAAVDQTIYIALWDATDNDYLKGPDGKILVKSIEIVDGEVVTGLPITFGADEALPNHTYYVSELIKTEDVNPDDIDRIKPADYADDEQEYVYNFANLTFVGTDSQGNEAVYQIKTPIAHEWDYDAGEYSHSSGRTADLSGSNNEARVMFENTYTPETTIEFIVQKQWGRRTIAEDGTWGMETLPAASLPENASVTITLYQNIGTSPWTAYTSITLDGTVDTDGEDVAWRAVFKDLPKFDTDESSPTYGQPYHYRADETDKPDEFEPFDAVTDHTPMGQHGNDELDYITSTGGIIYNIQKTTEITVKKTNDKGVPVSGATFQLLGPDVNGNEVLIKEFTVDSENGFTIDNLVSGDYKLVEIKAPTGYIIVIRETEFSVNALPETGENVISWKGDKPENVLDGSPSTTTNTGDTITIINIPGAVLPKTGGPGTLLYTLGGMMLLMSAALMYGFRMRRRERRL